MAYNRQRPNWKDYPDSTTVIRASDLNGIEDGLVAAASVADTALNLASTSATRAANAELSAASAANAAAAAQAAVTYRTALARNPDLLISGAVTRDGNGAATSAPVTWPDGSPGTYTALVVSTLFPGAVDSYQVTYGSPVSKTYTQPTITRDSNGAAVTVPAITVA